MRIRLARLVAAGVVLIGSAAMVTVLTAASPGSVRLISPKPGARVSGTIQLAAQVSLPDTSYVVFGVDQQRPCSTNSQPYICTLDTIGLSNGVHYLWVEAHGRYGLLEASPRTKLFVANRVAARPKPVRTHAPALAPQPAPTTKPKPSGGMEAITTVAETPDHLADALPASDSVAPNTVPPEDEEPVRQTLRSSGICIEAAGQDVTRPLCPVIRDSRINVRFRPMFQMLATRVHWDASRHRAIAFAPGLRIEVPIGGSTGIVNGKQVDLGGQAWISNGRTMLPVRFCLQTVAGSLRYDAATRHVALARPGETQALRPP
jgi:hypothetical protein